MLKIVKHEKSIALCLQFKNYDFRIGFVNPENQKHRIAWLINIDNFIENETGEKVKRMFHVRFLIFAFGFVIK
jgi:hypothetical protein